MISPPNSRARAIAAAVLPTAVGPAMTSRECGVRSAECGMGSLSVSGGVEEGVGWCRPPPPPNAGGSGDGPLPAAAAATLPLARERVKILPMVAM